MTILLGTNGTGKTTLLRSIISNIRERVLIITPDDAEWCDLPENDLTSRSDFLFSGATRHIFDPDKDNGTLSKIHNFKKGVIVFDDCRAYLQSATDPRIRNLLIRRRQREVDIFAVGHGFTEVPPVFFTFASDLFLFRTTDEIKRRKDCLKDFDLMVKYRDKVAQKTKSNPYYYEYIRYQ